MVEVISNVIHRLSRLIKNSQRPKLSKHIAQCSTTSLLGITESFTCKHTSHASAKVFVNTVFLSKIKLF